MNNPLVTASELRVRTVIKLITNENHYDSMYTRYAENTDIIIQAACKKEMYSEIHEVAALCNVLQCNIRSVYPRIDFEYYKAIWDSVFTPIPPVIGNCTIVVLWSCTLDEKDARKTYNGFWRPNHFVPLLSPPILNEVNSESISLVVKRSQANRAEKKHETVGGGQDSVRSSWPELISRDLKETRLQQFLEQMSMSKLAEATCAVCNIRTPAKDSNSKNLQISANNMWLGDIPKELQGLTIPEEKLISLYRHNSCIIKLQSPFHSTTTAQTALKGNCITFLQNVPNIVTSLPLKVIFIGARPPDRLHLRKVLTVQDDVPECIMSALEQKIDDEDGQSERTGYVPDPLMNPQERTTADVILISNSGVLDVNGSSVSSDEITVRIPNNNTNFLADHSPLSNDTKLSMIAKSNSGEISGIKL
ncbi:hypothetical protein I4U23_005750 [Adineta vaga]|nr:hypothetical protein I4U23_005750 [Adineta vaga]